MIYTAIVKRSDINDYDGSITLGFEAGTLPFYYQAPENFAREYLAVGSIIPVDLWLGLAEFIKFPPKFTPFVPFGTYPTDGKVGGQIESLLSPETFRMNCGALHLDVQLHHEIPYPAGTNVIMEGSRQVFFPDTEWDYDQVGCM